MINLLAETAPGNHPTISFCSSSFFCQVNYDSLISSAIAVVVTVVLIFTARMTIARKNSQPTKAQMILEMLLEWVNSMVAENVSPEAVFIVPLAATIGIYLLVANWLDFFPLFGIVHPAASDLNQTLALALVVFVVVNWYAIRARGLLGYIHHFTRPFDLPIWARVLFVPLNIIEELAKPVTLSLRLFGNIFAGVLMVYLLTTQIPSFIPSVALLAVWKAFDVFFVGTIQAFIFTLLTIIYFGMAREGLDEGEHRETSQTRNINTHVGETS